MSASVPTLPDTAQVSTAQLATEPPRARIGSSRSLARATSGGFALSVVNVGATVLTTIALARLMSLAAFGTYSWMVATVYLLSVPAVLGVDRLLTRDVAVYLGRGDHGHVRGLLRRSFQLVVASSSVIAAIIALVALAAGPAVDGAMVATLLIGVLGLPALAIGFVAQSALVGMHHVVVGQATEALLRPGLLLALVFGSALVGATISAPLAATLFTTSAVVSALVASTVLLRRMRTTVWPAAPVYETRVWLSAALSLVLLGGALLVNSQLGVVLLGLLGNAESAGLYAVAQRGALLVAFPLMALNAALAPTAARLWSRGDRESLQRLATLGARGVLAVSLPIALIFIFAGQSLLELVFGPAFGASAPSLAILAAGQIANAASGSVSTLLMMTGRQWRAMWGIAAGMLINVTLGVALIPSQGAAGAAIAAASGLIAANAIHVVMARATLRIDATALGLRVRSRS